ncbi:hypothetical protein, partial [Enterobacter intestinihominis]
FRDFFFFFFLWGVGFFFYFNVLIKCSRNKFLVLKGFNIKTPVLVLNTPSTKCCRKLSTMGDNAAILISNKFHHRNDHPQDVVTFSPTPCGRGPG